MADNLALKQENYDMKYILQDIKRYLDSSNYDDKTTLSFIRISMNVICRLVPSIEN